MDPKLSVKRRKFLASLSGVGFIGLTGCTDFRSDSTESDNDPTVVDAIEIVNGWDVPQTFEIILRSAESVLLWECFELDAEDSADGNFAVAEGPFGNGDEPLWVDVRAESPDSSSNPDEGEVVVTQPLGERKSGCVYVTILTRTAGGISVFVDRAEEIVSRETLC